MKPIELLLGHPELKKPIEIDDQILPNNHAMGEHKNTMLELYQKITQETTEENQKWTLKPVQAESGNKQIGNQNRSRLFVQRG